MSRKNIVAIDDEYSIRYFYKIALENDFNIITMREGNEAIDYINQNPDEINMIILDLMLPGIDGFTLLERFKSEDKTRSIPILVVSAKHQDEVIKKCKELGAESYLAKPFEPEKLMEKIKSIVR